MSEEDRLTAMANAAPTVKICPQCGGRWPADRPRCLACGASLADARQAPTEGTGEEDVDWSWLDAVTPKAGQAGLTDEQDRLWGGCLKVASGLLFLVGGYNLLIAILTLVTVTSPVASGTVSRFLWDCLLATLCLGLGFWLRKKARQAG